GEADHRIYQYTPQESLVGEKNTKLTSDCGRSRCGSSLRALRPPHRADLAAVAAAAEEAVLAVGFEARHADTLGHGDRFQHLAGLRVDVPEVALLLFPGAVPELAIHPGDAGDEAATFNGAQDPAGVGIDLVDLAFAIDTDP